MKRDRRRGVWSLVLALTLLFAGLLIGLILVPLGLPGLWIMLGSALAYWVAVPNGSIGFFTFVVASGMVIVAEILEFTIAGKYTRKYGGSRRASFGAIAGGLVGAFMGLPVPLIGSLLGAFAGAFVGALIGELTVSRETRGEPLQVARGALIGRVAAAAIKTGIGVAVLFWFGAASLVSRISGTG